mgnify:CR=1 FL=1
MPQVTRDRVGTAFVEEFVRTINGHCGEAALKFVFTLSAGLTMYGGRPNVGALRVLSKTGQDISNLTYSYASGPTFVSGVRVFNIDLAAGTATFASHGFSGQKYSKL